MPYTLPAISCTPHSSVGTGNAGSNRASAFSGLLRLADAISGRSSSITVLLNTASYHIYTWLLDTINLGWVQLQLSITKHKNPIRAFYKSQLQHYTTSVTTWHLTKSITMLHKRSVAIVYINVYKLSSDGVWGGEAR